MQGGGLIQTGIASSGSETGEWPGGVGQQGAQASRCGPSRRRPAPPCRALGVAWQRKAVLQRCKPAVIGAFAT